mmetsp:Transcript_46372/g.122890  ORF Transcript_46372/g.122890 Transcript_46372/m.122890 type:complete len:298 (-) Transcript_46372:314-1207(-)
MLPKLSIPNKFVAFDPVHVPARGSMSERMTRLCKPQNHEPPERPPTVGTKTRLPGMNSRYRQQVRTPKGDRSASERQGHAGLITLESRKLLDESMLRPILDMAAGSLSSESQMLAAPAITALAGVAANRKVMASFGAVEVLVNLVQNGKSINVKLEAWEAIHQLLQSSDACQRFLACKGLDLVLGLTEERDARIRCKASQVLARCLSKELIKMSERVSPLFIEGLCRFAADSDAGAAAAAACSWADAGTTNSLTEARQWGQVAPSDARYTARFLSLRMHSVQNLWSQGLRLPLARAS